MSVVFAIQVVDTSKPTAPLYVKRACGPGILLTDQIKQANSFFDRMTALKYAKEYLGAYNVRRYKYRVVLKFPERQENEYILTNDQLHEYHSK